MQRQAFRPVAVVAALALTLSAGLAPTAASAQQQLFGQWSTQNSRYQRTVTGTVTYFNQFDLRISAGNYGGYGNGYGNGNGRRHRHHRDDNNDDRQGNGGYSNGQYPNASQYPDSQQYPNSGPNGDPNGGYNNGYPNGGYNGRGNRSEQRIHLHQGTVINPRGTYLQNGMRLRITGHPNSDGTFEADRIDVVNGQGGYRNQ